MKKKKLFEVSLINKTYSKLLQDDTKFYTSDTALELGFQLLEVEYSFDSAEILLLNVDDRSFVTRVANKSADGFTYEIEDDIVAHYGEWKAQLKFEKDGEVYVSSPVVFRIENDLSNDRPPQLTDVANWETLRQSAKDLIAEMGDIVASEAARIEAEKERVEGYQEVRNFIDNFEIGENSVGTEEIKDGSVTVGKTNFITYGKNKFNPEATKDGVSLNSLGAEASDPSWSISEPMPVKQGETYTLTPKDSLFTYKRPAFFDTDKQFVSLIHLGTANYKINYKAPQDGYIIASVPTANKYHFSMTITSESDNFEPFIFVGVENLYVKPIPEENADTDEVNTSDFFQSGFNLFEQGIFTKGKFINDAAPTAVQSSATYNLYQNVDVEAGEVLNYREFGTGKGIRFVIFYDNNGNFLSGENYGTTGFQQGEITVPVGAVKASITVFDGDSTHVLSKATEIVEGQSNYQLKKSHGVLIGNDANTNPLSTKRLLGFGDSINQGGGNVVNGKGYGHIEMIAEDNNMNFKNYSVGGATVAPRDGYDNQIIKQINQAITANDNADIIIFNGLTNDASATPIDRIGDMTTGYTDALDLNTFAGSFEEICRSLKLNWLGTKIIYVRVHNMSSRGTQQVLYGEMAVKICKKYSISVVDMYNEGGLNTQMDEMKNLYTNNADSTHPNDLGYRTFYVPKVRAEMLIA